MSADGPTTPTCSPWPVRVGDVPEVCAARFGERVAFVVGEQRTTYAAWARGARRVARALVGAGVRPGDRVAFVVANDVAFFEAYTGIAQTGAVAVPLGNRLGHDELTFVVAHSQARLLVHDATTAASAGAVAQAAPDVPLVDLTALPAPTAGSVELPSPAPGDVAAIFYTSGSTADPKGVCLTHRNILACAELCAHAFDITADDVVLGVLPLHHTATHFGPLPALVRGGTVVLRDRFTAPSAFDLLVAHRVTLFPTVTAIAVLMANHQEETRLAPDLSSLRKIFVGGASVPRALLDAWESFAPHTAVVNTYGMTEMSPAIGAMDPSAETLRPGTVGRPYPGNEVRITGPDGRPAATGDVGEVLVRGPGRMVGYWRNEAATAEALRDGWLATGDLGFLDEDGYLTISGRKKWMLKRGGENVFPDEVEHALAAHPAVREVVVLGVPDDVMGERIGAVVVVRPDRPLTATELQKWALERMAAYKVPEFFSLTEALPRNAVGKVDTARLKNAAATDGIAWEDLRRGRARQH